VHKLRWYNVKSNLIKVSEKILEFIAGICIGGFYGICD